MTPAHSTLSLRLLLGLGLGASAWAQSAPPDAAPAEKKPDVIVNSSTDERRVSRALATTVTAGLPKFTPPKSEEQLAAEAKAAANKAAQDAADQPKNGIVRLPNYVVQGSRPPIFRERDIYTQKGLSQIALKRYFSETALALNRYTIPLFGMGKEAYAMMMYEEDERLKEMKNANNSVYLLRQTDEVAADQLQQEVNQTFLRNTDFSSTRGNSPE